LAAEVQSGCIGRKLNTIEVGRDDFTVVVKAFLTSIEDSTFGRRNSGICNEDVEAVVEL